jgi:hypothetical protein
MLHAQHLPGSTKTLTELKDSEQSHYEMGVPHSLDLITDEQDIVMCAQFADLGKVTYRWDDDSRLSLNRFEEDRSDLLAMELKGSSDIINLAISDGTDRVAITEIWPHASKVRPKPSPTLRVRAHATYMCYSSTRQGKGRDDRFSPDNTYRASMKVPCGTEDDCTTLCYPLLLICPLTRELDACLDRFRPRVHRQNHLIVK